MLAAAMVACAIVLAAWLVRRGASDPLRAVPAKSFLVLSVDVARLRTTPFYRAVFGPEGARTLGFVAITEACGFDPLTRAEALHLAVPDTGDRGDFGVVATGDVTADELVGCGNKLVAGSGPAPPMRDVGTFKVLSHADTGVTIAFRRGGPAIGGRGEWITTMIAAAEGREPSVAASQAHARMRRELGPAPVVLTAVMPRTLRDRLRKEWGLDDAGATPNAAPNPMSGVLAVETVALAIDPGVAGGQARVELALGCESASACASVQKLVERKRFEWGKDLGLRLAGVGALLDAVVIKADGAGLRVELTYGASELAALAERLLKLRKERRGAPPPPASRSVPIDERIPARDP
jgi:hypothetical protein